MKKLITGTIVGLIALGVVAATPASAETLTRSGANKVTITAQGAPAGAKVTKATVTVKKGKKTVAHNKKFYKAKAGTYKVTSTVKYKPAKQVTVPNAIITATCTVGSVNAPTVRTSHWQDNSYWVPGYTVPSELVQGHYEQYGPRESYWVDTYRTEAYDVEGYWVDNGHYVDGSEGWYTVTYTGTCTDWYTINGDIKWVTWNTGWSTEEYLSGSGADYGVGESMYVGSSDSVTVQPYYNSYGKTKTAKSTREVVVI